MDLFTIDTTGTVNGKDEEVSQSSSDEEVASDQSDEEVDSDECSADENESEPTVEEVEESMSEDESDLDSDSDHDSDVEEVPEPHHNSDNSGDEAATASVSSKLGLFPEDLKYSFRKKEIVKPRKNVFDFSDVYINFDCNEFGKSTVAESLQNDRQNEVNKLLASKSIAHQPGFDQLDCLPHSDLSKMKAKKLRKIEREKTKGDKWFNMPATEVTEEVKRDLEVLQMRSVLDPKTFYKKNDLKVLPKYFQLGRVMDNAADFYNSRIPKKERKRTMVEELLADAEFQQRSKQKFKEIVAEKKQFHSRAHKHAKRLKRKK